MSVGGSPVPGPIRVGRSTVASSGIGPPLSGSGQNFSLRTPVTNHHIRPPSPMVSHSRSNAVQQRPPSPNPRQIRAPSPLRDPVRTQSRVAASSLSINNELRPTPTPVRNLGGAGYRRSPSPMISSLPGMRQQSSAPMPWRSR
jgi:hypothetical protein